MGSENQQIADVIEFYRPQRDGEPNLFEIWDAGGSRGDSVTPSTYSSEYRRWMHDLLIHHLQSTGSKGLLSLGCGNAAVEAEVVRSGYRVVGVDALPEAVELAQAKGVEAICADLGTWSPGEQWSVIYIDGVLGHLYDRGTGIEPIMRRIRSWLVSGSSGVATLVASNDDTRDGSPVQPAANVRGFHWLSAPYLSEQALNVGFGKIEIEYFRYQRPQSGDRRRSVMVAHVRG